MPLRYTAFFLFLLVNAHSRRVPSDHCSRCRSWVPFTWVEVYWRKLKSRGHDWLKLVFVPLIIHTIGMEELHEGWVILTFEVRC
jgi:hypothetical protein